MPAVATPVLSTRLMTADEFYDYCQLPDNEHRNIELVRGEVIELPRPSRAHCYFTSKIDRILGNYSEATRFGYVCSNNTGVRLGNNPDTVRGPDVTFWNDLKPNEPFPEKWGTSIPILAVEVMSPNNKQREINEKLRDYLANGIGEVWIVDHEEKFIAVHHRDTPLLVFVETDILTSKVLPGFSFPVAEIFRMPNYEAAESPK